MKKFFCNERGFMLLDTIFVTMIIAFMAMMILNGTKKIADYNSDLKTIATYLANEQFAYIENIAATGNLSTGNYNFLGNSDDLENYFDSGNNKIIPVKFDISADVVGGANNLYSVEVIVEWNFNNIDEKIKFKKTVRNFTN